MIRQLPDDKAPIEEYQQARGYFSWIIALYAVFNGLAIVIGGPDRWSGNTYNVANQLPGSPYSWGWAICALGLALCAGLATRRDGIIFWSAGLAAFWCGVFATTKVLEVLTNEPDVSLQGPVTYSVLAALFVLRTSMSAVNRKANRKGG